MTQLAPLQEVGLLLLMHHCNINSLCTHVMSLNSDLALSADKFRPDAVSKRTHDFNDALIKIMSGIPKWYDVRQPVMFATSLWVLILSQVGAEKFRQMRKNNETPLPAQPILNGKQISIPSRDTGRQISCRIFEPDNGKAKGVFIHLHGGGWVFQDVSL